MKLIIRQFESSDYTPVWRAMQQFTDQRNEGTDDEVWLLQHPPVFTQGLAGKPEHVLNPQQIPVVQTDRGGQVTYHGPGQLMMYTLLDIQRLNIGAKTLVKQLEQCVIELLGNYQINASTQCGAPGVFVDDAKICSIGLRIRKGRSYHGIALNVKMDLQPFRGINPCGFKGLKMTQISDFIPTVNVADIEQQIIPYFMRIFGYTEQQFITNQLPELCHEQQATV